MITLNTLRANIGALIAGIVMVALAIACTVQTVRINGLHWDFKVGSFSLPFLNVDGWKETATTAQAALDAVEKAEPDAAAMQARVSQQQAIITAAIAKEANAQTSDYLRSVAVAAAGHAGAADCLRAAPAAQGVASQANLPGADRAAQGNDDKAGSSGMVSVAAADWGKVTRAAGFFAQLYQVGQAWIADGVAVAESDSAVSGDDPATH